LGFNYAEFLRGDQLEYITKLHNRRNFMDTIDLEKLFQRGYYVTLGATSSLLEVIQDPTKREENFKRFGRSFDEITQELAEKGVTTEAEARSYVDKFVAQQVSGNTTSSKSAGLTTVTTTAKTVDDNATDSSSEESDKSVKASMRDEIQELTQELASLRSQLEQLRSN
jgi:DNA phosphorothioation-dependent restriction protein DptG